MEAKQKTMLGVIVGVWITVCLGYITGFAAQLQPDVLVDKYLLQAEMLSEEKNHKGALEAMDRIVALQKEHGLTLSEDFSFHYAQTALAAGSVQAAIDSANRYLSVAGRDGKYYREALELLVKAERELPEPVVNRALSGQAEPEVEPQPQVVSLSPPETSGPTEAPQVQGCENWNTEKFFEFKDFFRSLKVGQLNTCLAAGADPNARDNNDHTPLHWTAYLARTGLVKALLTAGADPNARDNNDRTPLHVAGKKHDPRGSHLGVVNALLTAGADPKARDNQDRTPLHYGVTLSLLNEKKEGAKAIKKLLAAGADPMARDNSGKTPLHYAAGETYRAAARRATKTLLAAGADLEARDNSGRTPLHYAAGEGVDVKELLAFGPELEARDDDGRTPLHHATLRYYFVKSNVKALLNAGANLEARDNSGRTPLDVANDQNVSKVAKVLAAAKKRRKPQSGGGEGWAALVAGVTGAAIASAGGLDAATATEIGATIGGSVLAGEAVGSSGTGAASGGTSGNTGATAGSGPCQVPGYPNPPGGVSNLGFSWCPASVGMQVRAFALQAAGAQCAIATGSSSTPEQIKARRQEIRAACDRLAAVGARLAAPGAPNCQCPPSLR